MITLALKTMNVQLAFMLTQRRLSQLLHLQPIQCQRQRIVAPRRTAQVVIMELSVVQPNCCSVNLKRGGLEISMDALWARTPLSAAGIVNAPMTMPRKPSWTTTMLIVAPRLTAQVAVMA
jgi:hypothetical protein